MSETAPPAEVLRGRPSAQSSPATVDTSSHATRSRSSSSLFEEIEQVPPGERALPIETVSSDGSASDNTEAPDRPGTSPSDTAEAQLQPSPPSSVRATTDVHSVTSPVESSTTLRRRHTQHSPNRQQPQDQAGGGTNVPSTLASKAWTFFVHKFVPFSGALGLILVFVFGIGAWVGMNYANSYSKKQYDIAVFGACHEYEDIRNTAFCEKVINTGIAPRALVKRQEDTLIEEPRFCSRLMYHGFTVAKLVLQGLSQTACYPLSVIARRLQATQMYFVLWTYPMSIQNGGDYPMSTGLGYIILASWRISLFLGWQAVLLGCSRACCVACAYHMNEFLIQAFPQWPRLLPIILPLLLGDVAFVILSQAWAHWMTALMLLLVLGVIGTVLWARKRADTSSIVQFMVGFILVSLSGALIPCSLMHAARVGAFCLCLFGTLALWREWEVDQLNVMMPIKAWGIAAIAPILLGALLDLFQPNVMTFLFYRDYCS
ncbi:hypothetical protein BJX65DRAFT_27774 [Aspergillus insuetus]